MVGGSDIEDVAATTTTTTTTPSSNLSARHLAMMRDIVLTGMPLGEVSERYGVTPSSLTTLRKRKEWKLAEAEMREEVITLHKSRLLALNEKAIAVLDTLVDPKTNEKVRDEVKLNAARDILDRTGVASPKHTTNGHGVGTTINLFAPKWMSGDVDIKQDGTIDIEIGNK